MAEQFEKMHSHIEAIANAMPDPIFVMGQDGTYLDVIGGQERTLYADGHSLIGKNTPTFCRKNGGTFSQGGQ